MPPEVQQAFAEMFLGFFLFLVVIGVMKRLVENAIMFIISLPLMLVKWIFASQSTRADRT